MESLLGFQDSNNNPDEDRKLVPWLNWDEWDFVRASIFSSSPDSIAKALSRIMAWRSRGCLPDAVEMTASIIEIQQKDPHFREGMSNGGSDSEEILAMLYSMAIMRLVNGSVEDNKRKEKSNKSIADKAKEIGLPRMLADIRHEGSHRELPSLPLLRLASIEGLKWLKNYYWDLQKNAIPYLSGQSANVRKEIRCKLRELAFSLKVKKNSGSSSSQVKGSRARHHEQIVGATIHGRNKFFSILASKYQSSKYVGSKKQVTRTLKNLVRLYSFFSSDVVSVLLEFLLKASNSADVVDSPEKIQMNLSLDVAHAVFDEWKPVISKVCKKEPELLLSLLKAVLDMIESRINIRDDFGSEHFSLLQYDSEMQQIVVLSSLFKRLVLVLKGLKFIQHEDQGDVAGCLLKTSLMELVRRCLSISDPENRELFESAMLLTETLSDSYLREKLHKLSSLMKGFPRLVEHVASDVNTIDPNHQSECLRQAAEKLKLVKCRKSNNASVPTYQDNYIDDTSTWTIADSWNPCPIGMLPRAVSSSGCLPVLDNDVNGEIKTVSNSMDTEEPIDPSHSNKREASGDIEIINDSGVKRMKEIQDSDLSEPENFAVATPDLIKGSLWIGGVWHKVANQELQGIKSRVGILVTRR